MKGGSTFFPLFLWLSDPPPDRSDSVEDGLAFPTKSRDLTSIEISAIRARSNGSQEFAESFIT